MMADLDLDDFLGLNLDSDDEEEPLPTIVVEEIERRARIAKEQDERLSSEPPNMKAVEALRQHFLSEAEESDFSHGGFIDCMEALGAQPSAKDPLVYQIEYNTCYWEDTPEWHDEHEKKHEARVRLIQYRELIEYQALRGIKADDDWIMSSCNWDEELEYIGPDKVETNKDNLTGEQILALGKAFSMGFYYYANLDNYLKGLGAGVQSRSVDIPLLSNFPEGLSCNVQMDLSESILHDQCIELMTRYEELQCPFGPECVLNADSPAQSADSTVQIKRKKGKKGKKNRRGGQNDTSSAGSGWKSHSEEVISRLTKLLATIDEHFLPSTATACIVSRIAGMLSIAAVYDPDVAMSLVDSEKSKCGSMLIKLQAKALVHAKSTNKRQWWKAYEDLTNLLGKSVRARLEPHTRAFTAEEMDAKADSPASDFFFGKMMPVLLSSMQSSTAEERGPALQAFERVACGAIQSRLLRLLSKKKEVWHCIVDACCMGLDECKLSTAEARASSWQDHTSHIAFVRTMILMKNLSMRAATMDKSTSTVSPTALAVKMVKRGVVPLLMDVAKADLGVPSFLAMEGLAAISRVRDCRTIILEDAGGVGLVKKALSSKDAAMLSPSLLLIVHLMWDQEWWPHFSSMEPGLELTTVRWGLFAMGRIIERAKDRKKLEKEMKDRWMSLQVKAFKMEDGPEKAMVEQAAQDEQKQMELIGQGNGWLDLETEENRSQSSYLLGRCLLVLSMSLTLENGPNRLFKANGLSLLSACLDSLILDIQVAAINGLYNTIVTCGIEKVQPSMTCDPASLIRSTVIGLHRSLLAGNHSQRSQAFIQTLVRLKTQQEWAPYFRCLPEEHQMIVQQSTCHVRLAPAVRCVPVKPKYNINETCTQYTGKLGNCDACGKLETKRGDLSKCSKCKQVMYCSKECQIDHWHKGHKVGCKKLRRINA